MKKQLSIKILVLSIILLACNSKEQKSEYKALILNKTKKIENEKISRIETFQSFYDKFTSDSIFQMSRIKLPLNGYTNQKDLKEVIYLNKTHLLNDSNMVNINWTKTKWNIHRKVTDTTYKIQTIVEGDSLVFEKVYLPYSEFMSKSIFKKVSGLWYLIYYYDLE